jgi:8-oxo-dGTP pyrophosphatase MutT (NUDIX family)
METTYAAGILFVTPDKRALFLERSGDGDFVGYYDLPGGKRRPRETSQECAIRECSEEIGFYPSGELFELSRRNATIEGDSDNPTRAVDYITFIQEVDKKFTPPKLSDEHTSWVWAPLDNPPTPLHPGVIVSLRKLFSDELGIAKLMKEGELTSPQRYANITLFDIRITGTGLSYRSGIKEHVWRDKSIYLNEEFLERCAGLPVIFEHPESRTLNTQEYVDRNIGSVFIPYIKGEDVWAIVKVWDEHAARIMEENQLSTSPCVVLTGEDDQKIRLKSGSKLLIEGKPKLLDHIAVCFVGVWDKGNAPSGVSTATVGDLVMADDDKAAALEAARKADEAKSKADADKEKADAAAASAMADAALGAKLDSLMARFDAWDKSEKDKADKAKADAEEKEKADARSKMDAAEREKADAKAKADAEAKAKADAEKEEKEKADAAAKARADAEEEVRKRIADVESRLPKQMTDADYAAMADSQVRANRLYLMHGEQGAPRALDGESLIAYRRRLANGLKTHSKTWKDIDLKVIADDAAFGIIENTIYADAEEAGLHPADMGEDFLREIKSEDTTGRKISTFVGRPSAWMNQFAAPKRMLVGIRNHGGNNSN